MLLLLLDLTIQAITSPPTTFSAYTSSTRSRAERSLPPPSQKNQPMSLWRNFRSCSESISASRTLSHHWCSALLVTVRKANHFSFRALRAPHYTKQIVRIHQLKRSHKLREWCWIHEPSVCICFGKSFAFSSMQVSLHIMTHDTKGLLRPRRIALFHLTLLLLID